MDNFFYDKILNLFFPAKCGFCGNITENCSYVCSQCQINKYNEDREHCTLCGKKIYLDGKVCNECRERRVYYEKLIYYDEYKNDIKDKIIAYKFNDNSYLYNFFAELLLPKVLNEDIDIVTSVPISKKRMKERGYNQSCLIAKKIAKLMNISYKPLLLKIRETKRQSELSRFERAVNVQKTFKVSHKFDVNNKKILLIDDVYTTGATVNECSKILKMSGSTSIKVAVIAIS